MSNIFKKIGTIHEKLTFKIANTSIFKKIVKLSGNIINDSNKCTYCGVCARKCPMKAITTDLSSSKWDLNNDKCIRCRKCIRSCPKKSLSLINKHNSN